MLNRPAFFALLAAAGIAAAGYGCDLEDREAPKPNPKPIGGTPAAQGAGPGGTGANGGGGSSGEGAGSTTTGGEGGEGGSGGGPGLAAQLFPFCGCLENGSDSGECFDCLWGEQINGCVQEALNCDQSANCIELQQFFQDGLCQDVTPMCIDSAIQGLEPGVGPLAVYLKCACTVCADLCPASACQ